MLTSLSIRDVVLIEKLDLEFGEGLGVLTGETGAGKSILLDALGLALGRRADSGLVRSGSDQARVTASFELGEGSEAIQALLDDAGIETETGEPLTIRRSVKADGGSRAHIADQPCSAALLRDVGAHLVEIHGQHDDRGLVASRGHRLLLDAYAGNNPLLTQVGQAYARWKAIEAQLTEARDNAEAAARDRDFLEHSIAELTALAPEVGEEETLAEERATMQRGEKIAEDLAQLETIFDGADGANAQLRVAARILERIGDAHPSLTEALAALDRALVETGETENSLATAREALAFDPDRLDAAERRLFDLRGLARKHQVEVDALPALLDEMRTKMADIESGGASLHELESRLTEARETFVEASGTLTEARKKAGAKLDATVAKELEPLKLDAARFQTAITSLDEAQWSASGADRVEFLIATNPGADFAPLAKIASGGELSRFILALKVALAERGGVATIIFDEIDRGVGGAVASAIGERLARLADGRQLLAVTHSPQVAAAGAQHYFIAKSSDGTVTRTGVNQLSGEQRRQEIARMLSGAEVTDEARAQADRLLEAS